MKKLASSLGVLLLLVNLSSATKSHPITTLINAKWNQTPLQLEFAEFLADENPQNFWSYVDYLAALKIELSEQESDLQRYKTSIDFATQLLTSGQLSLLKLSLSLHSLTPLVQSHLQIAEDLQKHGDCGTAAFVAFGNEVLCSVKDLKAKLSKKSSETADVDIYTFDHIYPGSENNTVTTILYGELGSSKYNEFHRVLKAETVKGVIKYVSR